MRSTSCPEVCFSMASTHIPENFFLKGFISGFRDRLVYLKGLNTQASVGHPISFLSHEISVAEGNVSFMTYMLLCY